VLIAAAQETRWTMFARKVEEDVVNDPISCAAALGATELRGANWIGEFGLGDRVGGRLTESTRYKYG
jgi:hypothetical protein